MYPATTGIGSSQQSMAVRVTESQMGSVSVQVPETATRQRMFMLSIIAGCGASGDPAKTKEFVDSYDRAMTRISSICRQVTRQVVSGERLTPAQRAAFIIVYGRAAADV